MDNTEDFFKDYRGRYSQYWVERWGLIPELPTSFDNANSMYELVAWLQRAFTNLLDDFQQLESEVEDFKNALIDLLEYLIPELIRRYHDSAEFRAIFIILLEDILAGEERTWVKDLLKELLETDMREWIEDYLKELYGNELNELFQDLNDIAVNIRQFPRLESESEDCPRFKRAIEHLSNLGGGTLQLGATEYIFNTGFTIPSNIKIKGQGNKAPFDSDKVTLLKYFGEGDFITISSYYNRKSTLSNLNITCGDGLGRNSQTTGVRVLYNDSWGGSAVIEKVSISQFGIGIQHIRTWQSIVKDSVISECGKGISYNAFIAGKSATFGNGNTVELTTIYGCNIGVELASDTLNTFKGIDIEKCYIGILSYKLDGYLPPMQHRFENCWLEANGWKTTEDKINNRNPRYVVCNSAIDNDFLAKNINTVSLDSLSFVNCRFDLNVSPQVPSFNSNYDIYRMDLQLNNKQYLTDEDIKNFYKRESYPIETATVGIEQWKRFYSLSNKGLNIKLGFNLYENSGSFITTDVTTQKISVNYSKIINPVPENLYVANQFSSIAIMNVGVKHNNGYFNNRVFIISDFAVYGSLMIQPIGDSTNNGTMLTGNKIEVVNIQGTGTNAKTFDVQVTGNLIKDVNIKINFLPSGLLV